MNTFSTVHPLPFSTLLCHLLTTSSHLSSPISSFSAHILHHFLSHFLQLLPRACRYALCTYVLYEVGLELPSEASAKAIVRKAMCHDPTLSMYLARQALQKLHRTVTDAGWGQQMNNIIEFLRVLLTVEGDDLVMFRVNTVLLEQNYGLATIAALERARPSICRTNEYERTGVFSRYLGNIVFIYSQTLSLIHPLTPATPHPHRSLTLSPRYLLNTSYHTHPITLGFIQELCLLPVFSDGLHALAAEHERARSVKKCLRFPPHSTIAGGGGNMNLPEWDAYVVSHTTVEVSKGIRPEVNGIYNFVAFKQNAGYYSRLGSYDGNPALFTLYKCTVNNGGYQWFISVTPEGLEPGTNRDVDFYFSHAKSEFYGNG